LKGGGTKGAYQAGVLKGLIENLPAEEVAWDVISGISHTPPAHTLTKTQKINPQYNNSTFPYCILHIYPLSYTDA
jgi:hypothetical protein